MNEINLKKPDEIIGKNLGIPTKGSFYHLLKNRHKNGFDNCVFKIGSRVLVDEVALKAWLESRRLSQTERKTVAWRGR